MCLSQSRHKSKSYGAQTGDLYRETMDHAKLLCEKGSTAYLHTSAEEGPIISLEKPWGDGATHLLDQ
jgi:hypothetical protein